MTKHFTRDNLFATISWIIVVVLLYSAVTLFFIDPSGAGPVASATSIMVAKWFYIILFVSQSALLAFSKWKKRNKMRKRVLLFIYLTGFFTSILAVTIIGFTPALIDNVVVSVSAAACWLHWTFKTEYVDVHEFMSDEHGN